MKFTFNRLVVFVTSGDTFSPKIRATQSLQLTSALESAVGGGAADQFRLFAQVPLRPIEYTIPPQSIGWYQTYLGRRKH